MKKYIDLHCHPFREYFEEPIQIIEDSFNQGLDKMFLVGTDLNNCQEAISLSKLKNYTYAILGIHPNDAKNKQDLIALEKMIIENLDSQKIVGIGEVGLDYHYDDSPSKEDQIFFFKSQIEMALKYNLALIVHSREAAKDTYEILKNYKTNYPQLPIILHSYSYGLVWMEKFLAIGCYFSYSGIVTFKNAKEMQESALKTPLEALFYETDTPYLTPAPHRGKTNYPHYAIYVADFIASLKGISSQTLVDQVNKNLKKVFKEIK
ncbi:MAG: TatD family hydrolase [Metamycoplasmataceae bacterium]